MSRVLAKQALHCHSDQQCKALQGAGIKLAQEQDGTLKFEYVLVGAIADILLPLPASPIRADGLWQTTCFELFVADGAGYREFNFSPSGQWAAYRFSSYRNGRAMLEMPPPAIHLERNDARLVLTIELDATALPSMPWKMGVSAVIEAADGTKSYWALAHPPGKPDFHHPACFALELPYPEAFSAKVGTGFASENASDE